VTSAVELADAVVAARERLIVFVHRCPDHQWHSFPLADGDPRALGVIVDHVADAYEYLGTWVGDLARGDSVDVNPACVDKLNARHAIAVVSPSREDVIAHLVRSGDAFVALIASLAPDQLWAGEARIARFAEIAARHADDHRVELETALGPPP
jgi:hypothetical protein